MTPQQGRNIGEQRRDDGMRRAARRKEWLIRHSCLRMLEAIRHRPDRTATTDDATTDISMKFDDGGKWRGSVPKRLAADGLIERVGVVKSARPCRHRGYVSRWRSTDDRQIDIAIDGLRRWHRDNPEPPDDRDDGELLVCLFPSSPKKPSDAAATASPDGGAR